MLKNWKTSLMGVITLVLTVLPVVQQWLQENAAVQIGIQQILQLALGVGLLLAKDHNVSGT